MINHFKYEVNEVNLRLQLKGHEVPFSDDAWKRFESFLSSQKTVARNDFAQRFSVKLNRNVILPMVFGLVIILFSFLLFNFVNIKNPNTETSAKIELRQNLVLPKSETVRKNSSDRLNIHTGKEPSDSVSKQTIGAAEDTDQTLQIIPNYHNITKSTQSVYDRDNFITAPKAEGKSDSGKNNVTSNNATSMGDLSYKKKSKKNEDIITEPNEDELDQTPPPVYQAESSTEMEVQN